MVESDAEKLVETPSVIRAVVWGQMLWTIGFSLTTGGFLTYFAYEIGAKAVPIAVILVIPEMAGVCGVFSRTITKLFGNRKRTYIWCSLIARFVSLLIPALAIESVRESIPSPIWVLIAVLAATNIVQAIAYNAYISWLTDLVPEYNWGRLFARRSLAKVGILIFVPMIGGFSRDYWKKNLGAEQTLWIYLVVFCVGTLFLTLSLLPMLRLPSVSSNANDNGKTSSDWSHVLAAFANPNTRYAIFYAWWLAFFQGITQSPFFFYSVYQLKISLGTYYAMAGVMYGLQFGLSIPTGNISDRNGNKLPLMIGLFAVAMAMPFWMLATPETWWWLIGAYILWGVFAVVNITGRNLLLKVSPRGDNQIHFGLFRQVAGLIAGASGLLGGYLLTHLQKTEFSYALGSFELTAFSLIFLISFVGRLMAPLWLIPVKEANEETPSLSGRSN